MSFPGTAPIWNCCSSTLPARCALPAPDDFTPLDRARSLDKYRYRAEDRSVVELSAQVSIEKR